jgi:hypothetical protein
LKCKVFAIEPEASFLFFKPMAFDAFSLQQRRYIALEVDFRTITKIVA